MQATETQVKTYDNAKSYQKDVKKMSKQGWSVVGSTVDVKKHFFGRPTQQIIVTYQRLKK